MVWEACEYCKMILRTLYAEKEDMGLRELARKHGFNKNTLKKHLDDLVLEGVIEKRSVGNKVVHYLSQRGASIAFRLLQMDYGNMMREVWADYYLKEDWDPIDVSDIITKSPNEVDKVYLMKRFIKKQGRTKVETKLVVPPFFDAEIHLHLTGRSEDIDFGQIITQRDASLANRSEIRNLLEEYITHNKVEAALDPGPRYKRFLSILREYVGDVRYTGMGPFPFSKEIQHQEEMVRKWRSPEEAIQKLGQEFYRGIQNPPNSGMIFRDIRDLDGNAVGYWVIYNRADREKITKIFSDLDKKNKFLQLFIKNLLPFLAKVVGVIESKNSSI